MEKERKIRTTEKCLLQSEKTFPQRDIWECKFCDAKSTDTGNLADKCLVIRM